VQAEGVTRQPRGEVSTTGHGRRLKRSLRVGRRQWRCHITMLANDRKPAPQSSHPHVRFGSEADIPAPTDLVCFVPYADCPQHWKIPRPNETRLLVRVPAPNGHSSRSSCAGFAPVNDSQMGKIRPRYAAL
jgi:hypothetical protein